MHSAIVSPGGKNPIWTLKGSMFGETRQSRPPGLRKFDSTKTKNKIQGINKIASLDLKEFYMSGDTLDLLED